MDTWITHMKPKKKINGECKGKKIEIKSRRKRKKIRKKIKVNKLFLYTTNPFQLFSYLLC